MSDALHQAAPRQADRYIHGHHRSVLASHRARTAQNSAAYLIPELRSGMRLLDVGCGPGSITADLAEMVAPGEVVALDRVDAVVADTGRLAHQRGITTVTPVTGDVYQLDFPDNSFDVVHAHQVLQHLTRPVDALKEMARVTKPGGVVAARDADYAAMAWYPADDRLDSWLRVYRAVAHGNGAEPDAARRLLHWAGQAGLSHIRPSTSTWCWADPDSRRWWAETWAERVQHSALATQAIAGGHATEQELAAMADGFLHWAEQPDGWFVVLHGEILATPATGQDGGG